MGEVMLQERTRQFLEESLLGEQDVDTKVRSLLEAEYLRRLGRYRRLDRILTQKYGMTFEEFIARRVVQQKGYTWDVETDAMDWETAVGGMRTMERKIQELRESERVQRGRPTIGGTGSAGEGVVCAVVGGDRTRRSLHRADRSPAERSGTQRLTHNARRLVEEKYT